MLMVLLMLMLLLMLLLYDIEIFIANMTKNFLIKLMNF